MTVPDRAGPVIGIDGPNGVGKTAVARELARRLGWRWLSVGMVYRALAAVGAPPGTAPRVIAAAAADGVADPLVEVEGRTFGESELAGERYGREAARLAGDRGRQAVVNAALRAYAGGGLVAEGRATREIFPDAVMAVYLWADPAERARRSAAVTGETLDPVRERGDANRSSEPLRIHPGTVVWNSTRHTMEQTVTGLTRRLRLLNGDEPVAVAVEGPPPDAAKAIAESGLRLVDRSAGERVDALVVLPPSTPAGQVGQVVRAHLPVLLAGNDLISIGSVQTGAAPTATQRMLEAAPWPLGRWLRVGWLGRHGHLAIAGDVVGSAKLRCFDPDSLTLEQMEMLEGARWVPNTAAAVSLPGAHVAVPCWDGPAEMLAAVRTPDATAWESVDLRRCADPRAALWLMAGVPGRVMSVDLPWRREPPGASPGPEVSR
ncbi:(d)CMP kinase [Spirillospora sp. CA-142024]|uniref:(d)CMP kinase n=1 Tax=Spirillospora sp. CA-142024 TaxID=3240036 RepID=UPI003D925A41